MRPKKRAIIHRKKRERMVVAWLIRSWTTSCWGRGALMGSIMKVKLSEPEDFFVWGCFNLFWTFDQLSKPWVLSFQKTQILPLFNPFSISPLKKLTLTVVSHLPVHIAVDVGTEIWRSYPSSVLNQIRRSHPLRP